MFAKLALHDYVILAVGFPGCASFEGSAIVDDSGWCSRNILTSFEKLVAESEKRSQTLGISLHSCLLKLLQHNQPRPWLCICNI